MTESVNVLYVSEESVGWHLSPIGIGRTRRAIRQERRGHCLFASSKLMDCFFPPQETRWRKREIFFLCLLYEPISNDDHRSLVAVVADIHSFSVTRYRLWNIPFCLKRQYVSNRRTTRQTATHGENRWWSGHRRVRNQWRCRSLPDVRCNESQWESAAWRLLLWLRKTICHSAA